MDVELNPSLVNIAEKNNVSYKVDVYVRYGSDATQAVRSGSDIDFACIGPGTDSSHHYERTHIESIENTMKLLTAYILEK